MPTINKRWGAFKEMPGFSAWHASAKPGSTFYSSARNRLVYVPTLLQTFSNSVYKPGKVTTGSVQVSVGFVDLCSLIYNDLEVAKNLVDATENKVYRWIGYEMSPYCVAKTLIIADMMRSSTAEAVFQVWYSSTWTKSTQTAFLQSISNVLNSGICKDNDVLYFLTYWMSNKVTLKEAGRLWLLSQTETHMEIGNLKREVDRNALCSYYLNGQLLGGDIGSTVMFCNPQGAGDLALNHEFLQTVYYPLLAKSWCNSPSSVIEVGVDIVLNKISTWMESVKAGLVEIEARLKKVDDNSSILREICSLKPDLLSWSNVPDYIHPETFFRMARTAGSEKRVVHQFYSMNWPQTCFGVCPLDFPKEKRKELIAQADKHIHTANAANKLQSKLQGAYIIDHPLNTSTSHLAFTHHRSWLKSYLKMGGVTDPSQTLYVECQDYNLFHRGPGTVYVSFSFSH